MRDGFGEITHKGPSMDRVSIRFMHLEVLELRYLWNLQQLFITGANKLIKLIITGCFRLRVLKWRPVREDL